MLQTFSPQQAAVYEDHGQAFDLASILRILNRRILFFAIPFLLVVMLGFGVVAIQRPIYRSEGKILVQSPEIPPDLVHPTITEVANERVQVIQQRITARDNLLAVVNKFNLFPRERQWMSGTELLDLVRSRMVIKPVELDQEATVPGNPTIAFTLSFDYEVPSVAAAVANEFLTSILSQDADTRTNNAAETTRFLEREVKRLEGEHDAVVAQIEAIKQQPPDKAQTESEETTEQIRDLSQAEADLAQASAVYSDEYPVVKNLKKKIASLKHAIATSSKATESPGADNAGTNDVNLLILKRREADLSQTLEEENKKLTTARLGESMERGQQGERLQVIEQPSLPTKPVRPQKLKWFAVAFALAGLIGAGSVTVTEMLDGSIRASRDLYQAVDRHLIVAIPYLSTPGEQYRKRRNFILLCAGLIIGLTAAIAAAIVNGISVDFSWFDRSWLDALTRIIQH
jgi:capsular polysaccharide biosynthesis protein